MMKLTFKKNQYNDITQNSSLFTRKSFRITAGRFLESLALVRAYFPLIQIPKDFKPTNKKT